MPIELVVALDSDDPSLPNYTVKSDGFLTLKRVVGSRTSLGTHYNRAWQSSTGKIIMITGDDMMFRTPNWDEMVSGKATSFTDNIYCICGLNTKDKKSDACMFVSRKSTDALGYAAPSYLNRYIDTYLSAVYTDLHRHIHVPYVIEHKHHLAQKRPKDLTDEELNTKLELDQFMWKSTSYIRKADVETLRPLMTTKFKLF